MVLTVAMMVLVFVDAWFLLSVFVSESMVVVMAISSVRWWWWFRRWRDVVLALMMTIYLLEVPVVLLLDTIAVTPIRSSLKL